MDKKSLLLCLLLVSLATILSAQHGEQKQEVLFGGETKWPPRSVNPSML